MITVVYCQMIFIMYWYITQKGVYAMKYIVIVSLLTISMHGICAEDITKNQKDTTAVDQAITTPIEVKTGEVQPVQIEEVSEAQKKSPSFFTWLQDMITSLKTWLFGTKEEKAPSTPESYTQEAEQTPEVPAEPATPSK